MKVIGREEFIKRITDKGVSSEETIDLFIEVLFEVLKEEQSIKYQDYPLIRTKLSKSTLNIANSPKTRRNERINVLIKIDKEKN